MFRFGSPTDLAVGRSRACVSLAAVASTGRAVAGVKPFSQFPVPRHFRPETWVAYGQPTLDRPILRSVKAL